MTSNDELVLNHPHPPLEEICHAFPPRSSRGSCCSRDADVCWAHRRRPCGTHHQHPDRPVHDRRPRARLQLGLLPGRRVQPRHHRAQLSPARTHPCRHDHQADASGPRRRLGRHRRQWGHHPGNATDISGFSGAGTTGRLHQSDGPSLQPHRLRRHQHWQPRVQLRRGRPEQLRQEPRRPTAGGQCHRRQDG